MKITVPIREKKTYQSQDMKYIEGFFKVDSYEVEIPDGQVDPNQELDFGPDNQFYGIFPMTKVDRETGQMYQEPEYFNIEGATTVSEAFQKFNECKKSHIMKQIEEEKAKSESQIQTASVQDLKHIDELTEASKQNKNLIL